MENSVLQEYRNITGFKSKNQNYKKKSVEILSTLLLHTYVLHLKTFNCLWNIKLQNQEKSILKEQLNETQKAISEISDTIRFLGYDVQSGFNQVQRLSEINFDRSENLAALEELLILNDSIVQYLQDSIEIIVELKDFETFDFLSKRQEIHKVNSIMINSIIQTNKFNIKK